MNEKKKWKEYLTRSGKYIPVAATFALLFLYCYLFLTAFLRVDDNFYQFQLSMKSISLTNQIAAGDVEEDMTSLQSLTKPGFLAKQQEARLPVRNDLYEGPVFAMTATGDNQDIQTERKIWCEIQNQYVENSVSMQPLLNVRDIYKIWNLSEEAKTMQLVYPFVTTLNRGYELEESLLQIDKRTWMEESTQPEVNYCAGKSISAFYHRSPLQDSSLSDYELLLNGERNIYMEQTLQNRESDSKEMQVYLFRDFTTGMQTETKLPVVGIHITQTDQEIYTFGFDYEEELPDGTMQYSFFVPQIQEHDYMLIVPRNTKIEIGYYSNLDCEEKISGVSCQTSKYQLGRFHAFKVCAQWMMQQLKNDYENGLYKASLPDYLDDEMLLNLLVNLGEGDSFDQVLYQRYQTTELMDIFEQILKETRIVYALVMVTIPPNEMIQITANTQKRQIMGNYETDLTQIAEAPSSYVYDFFVRTGNRLNIEKASMQCVLPPEWGVADSGEGWREKKKEESTIWKRNLNENSYQFQILR